MQDLTYHSHQVLRPLLLHRDADEGCFSGEIVIFRRSLVEVRDGLPILALMIRSGCRRTKAAMGVQNVPPPAIEFQALVAACRRWLLLFHRAGHTCTGLHTVPEGLCMTADEGFFAQAKVFPTICLTAAYGYKLACSPAASCSHAL